MKIYLASPGIDTGVFTLIDIYIYHLLFSYYDLCGLGFKFRRDSWELLIEGKENNESK